MLPMLRLLRIAGPNALASGQQVSWLHSLTGRSSTSQEDIHAANEKPATTRTARASCVVHLGPVAFPLVDHNRLAKGDVLSTAELAGIMAAKQTANLIPLCHNITLSKVAVDLHLDAPSNSVRIVSTATTVSATGVEMEALTAAAVAALTVYDMCKAAAKDIEITDLKLDAKSGGKSSDYLRGAANHGNVVNLPHGANTPNPTS